MGFAPQPKPLAPTNEAMTNYLKACADGRIFTVRAFLDNWPKQTEVHWTESKMTGLLCAAKAGQADIVALLIERGADTRAFDKEGTNALMLAAQSGNEKLVETLLDLRILRAYAKDAQGRTALHHYVAGGEDDRDSNIPALLVKHGAGVNDSTLGGVKPLQSALSLGRKMIFRGLLDLGADISDPTLSAFAGQMDTPDFAEMLQEEPARRQRLVDDAINAGIGNAMKVSKPFNLSKEPRKKEPPASHQSSAANAASLARLLNRQAPGRSWVA